MEAMTVAQIIAVISTAAVAVGMHGSILIFGLFLPPGALLVELFPYAVPAEQYRPYRTMAELPALRLHYSAWENRLSANSVGYPDRPKAMGGLQHLSPEEREQVLAVTRVPPHLCCSDPYWLYRIYQDTTVDVEVSCGGMFVRCAGFRPDRCRVVGPSLCMSLCGTPPFARL